MGTVGDINKALKQNGFKLMSVNKHAIYQNAEGRIVRLHMGSSITDMKYRSVMKDIVRGNVISGKVAKAQTPATWVKQTSQTHVLVRGVTELGRVQQVLVDGQWMWETRYQNGEIGPTTETLVEAKAWMEDL